MAYPYEERSEEEIYNSKLVDRVIGLSFSLMFLFMSLGFMIIGMNN